MHWLLALSLDRQCVPVAIRTGDGMRLYIAAVVPVLAMQAAVADFDEGVAAYDRGDYVCIKIASGPGGKKYRAIALAMALCLLVWCPNSLAAGAREVEECGGQTR